ncbi:MAG TPA: choice-of-anchor M domain-containing protein [Rugosimonospora sp.]|nr:choice-of-anchor M domain-containing protein [Rugosimonospora sp.]
MLLAPTTAAADEAAPDPNLQQTLAPDQPIAHGQHVIETGHVDMGPKYDGDAFHFLIHDDAHRADASATSVWRYPDETVLRVVDAAELTVPDDATYSFVGADPGATVWVVPQTQNPEVVWVGWNTQDPDVMATLDRGATFALTGAQGPGVMTVYLQSGDFGAPQVLWDSRVSDPQPVWVDVNTHTHANWVFTAPGVYLVRMQVSADLIDGSSVSDSQLIRFAVGSATSTDEALATAWTGPADTGAPSASPTGAATAGEGDEAGGAPVASGGAPAQADGSGSLVTWLIVAIAVVAAAMIAGFTIVIVRGNRAKRRVLAARAASRADGGGAA